MLIHIRLEVRARLESYPNRFLVIVKYNVLNVRLDKDMKVREFFTLELRVDIRMRGILALPVRADITLSAH